MTVFSKSAVVGCLIAFGSAGLAFGQAVTLTNFDAKKLRDERATFLEQINCGGDDLLCGKPSLLAPNVLVLGDSHATDAFNTMYSAFPEVNFLLSRVQGCAPYAESDDRDAKCADSNAARWGKIDALKNISALVIKIRLTKSRADNLIAFIKEVAPKFPKLVVFGAGPLYERELAEVYERFKGEKLGEFRNEAPYAADAAVRAAVESVGGVFIDQNSFFCPGGQCTDISRDGTTLVVVDEHHQTLKTTQELGSFIRTTIPDIFKSN